MFQELLMILMNWMPLLCGYVHTSNFPQPLSKKEEKECLLKMKDGDADARSKLIEHNLRLVVHIVKKYECKEDIEDLISIGTIGLIKGIDSFDLSKGLKLTTYVSKCIENEILMSFRKTRYQPTVSLDDAIGSDKDGNLIRLFEVIQDTKQPNVVDRLFTNEQIHKLLLYLNRLNEMEKDILIKRYGLDGKECLTQKEIAKEYDISRSYV